VPFHRARNACFACLVDPEMASARAVPNFASGAGQQLPAIPASVKNFRNSPSACPGFIFPAFNLKFTLRNRFSIALLFSQPLTQTPLCGLEFFQHVLP